MRHETSRTLFDYWNTIRNGRPAPERSEVEPSDVRHILGDTFILEISRQMRTIAYRLAGTRLCSAHGRELKGLGYLALWQEEDNYEVAKAIHRVYTEYNPVVLAYAARSASDRFVEYESVLLPLMPAADGNARILGSASPKKPPYWLGADPIVAMHLKSVRVIEKSDLAPALVPAPRLQMAASRGGDAEPRRRGHLMVFDGGLSAEPEA